MSGKRQYRACIWCDRPFHVWRFELAQRNRGKFCSSPCYAASRRAFSDMLASGQLESLLAPQRERAKLERLRLMQESAREFIG
jgi:hypothetical protein